jgi:hypothetical protein
MIALTMDWFMQVRFLPLPQKFEVMKVGDKILPSLRGLVKDSAEVSIASRATLEARVLVVGAIWGPVLNTVPNSLDMKASAKKLIIQKS